MKSDGELTYRLYTEADIPGLLSLWAEESPWGELDAATWKSWFVDTPFGDCPVFVAVDSSGAVVAQQVFTPSKLQVGSCEVDALRLSAPILRRELRNRSLRQPDHPILALSRLGVETALARGYAVVYSLPERGWLPIFHYASRIGLPAFGTSEYRCLQLGLPDFTEPVDTANGGTELRARWIREFGSEYVGLWKEATASFPIQCGVVRDPHWLRWRNGGNLVVEVRERSGRLAGFASFKKQERDLLLFDFLAPSRNEILPVLWAALHHLARRGSAADPTLFESKPDLAVKAMDTPIVGHAMRALGASPADYTFAFACVALDRSLPDFVDRPDSWYAMPGD